MKYKTQLKDITKYFMHSHQNLSAYVILILNTFRVNFLIDDTIKQNIFNVY